MSKEFKRKPFWSVREVAEYLDVEYKTLYRQVLAGNLPAVKIGGIFRIKQEDIDAFLEYMRVPKRKEHESMVNAFRKDIYANLYPERSATGLACARCGRLMKSINMIGGECQHPSCEAILCTECYADEDDRYCRAHRISAREKLSRAKQRLERREIDVLVTAEEARERELNFIGRFDQKIRGQKKIVNPIDGIPQVVNSWEAIHQEETEFDFITPSSAEILDKDAEGKIFPRNISSTYHFGKQSSSKGSNCSIVIRASCISHVHEHLQNDFDTRPLSYAELVWLLEQNIEEAKADNSLYILGIGSPTGFDAQAKQAICGGGSGRVFSSLYVAVCLADLNANELFHNPADSRVKPFVELYRGDLDGEAVEKVKDFLRNKLVERASQTITEVMEGTGQSRDVVMEALAQLSQEEGYSIVNTDNKGEVVILREG
ncbi:MAG: helix-turn-helix domain-containing protein [Dehalococcoidia bacterium]|nr:helix-turn-helix domain-containing protein [Dehalococcoidia bacterium]